MTDPRSGTTLESFLMGYEMCWCLLGIVDADVVVWHHSTAVEDGILQTKADIRGVNFEAVRWNSRRSYSQASRTLWKIGYITH